MKSPLGVGTHSRFAATFHWNERKLALNIEQQMEIKSHPSTMEVLLEEAIQTLHPGEQAGLFARNFEGPVKAELRGESMKDDFPGQGMTRAVSSAGAVSRVR